MLVFFSASLPGTFLTVGNFQSILTTESALHLLALNLTAVLAVGDLDLSIGEVNGFTAQLAPSGIPRSR